MQFRGICRTSNSQSSPGHKKIALGEPEFAQYHAEKKDRLDENIENSHWFEITLLITSSTIVLQQSFWLDRANAY